MTTLRAGGRRTIPAAQQFDKQTARERTDEAKRAATNLWLLVLELYEGAAHVALDYGSWREYWEAEFGGSGTRGEQLVRAGRIARALDGTDLPLPANDTTARELLPVLRQAPDQLADVWKRSIDAFGVQPTSREVRQQVAAFRLSDSQAHNRSRISSDRALTAQKRNLVRMPLRAAQAGLEGAQAALEDALATNPSPEMLQEWRDHADAALEALNGIIEELRGAQ